MSDSRSRATILNCVSVTDQVRADINTAMKSAEREHVAAQEHVRLEMRLQRAQHRVSGAGELTRHRVVELELLAH